MGEKDTTQNHVQQLRDMKTCSSILYNIFDLLQVIDDHEEEKLMDQLPDEEEKELVATEVEKQTVIIEQLVEEV